MNKKTIMVLFVVLIPFLLILFSYKVVLFTTTMAENQKDTVKVLNGERSWLDLEQKNITKAEISHLNDVQQVMNGTNYLFYVLLFVCTLIFTYFGKKEKINLLKYGGIATLGFVGGIALLTWISFNLMFTWFHQIFFPQGNWQFPLNSFLITTFPLTFFVSMAWKIFLMALILAILFILVSIYLKRR